MFCHAMTNKRFIYAARSLQVTKIIVTLHYIIAGVYHGERGGSKRHFVSLISYILLHKNEKCTIAFSVLSETHKIQSKIFGVIHKIRHVRGGVGEGRRHVTATGYYT